MRFRGIQESQEFFGKQDFYFGGLVAGAAASWILRSMAKQFAKDLATVHSSSQWFNIFW